MGTWIEYLVTENNEESIIFHIFVLRHLSAPYLFTADGHSSTSGRQVLFSWRGERSSRAPMPSGVPCCPAPPAAAAQTYVGKYETMMTAYVIYCGRRTFERGAISRDEVARAAAVAAEAPPEREMRGGDKEPFRECFQVNLTSLSINCISTVRRRPLIYSPVRRNRGERWSGGSHGNGKPAKAKRTRAMNGASYSAA